MQILMTLFTAALFLALTPGILLAIPPKGSLLKQAVVHGLLFAVIYHFTNEAFYTMVYGEGFDKQFSPMYAKCGLATNPSGGGGETPMTPECA